MRSKLKPLPDPNKYRNNARRIAAHSGNFNLGHIRVVDLFSPSGMSCEEEAEPGDEGGG